MSDFGTFYGFPQMPVVYSASEVCISHRSHAREKTKLGFEESARGDRAMREALFLTFNVDLGFFEERILGAVRSSGAAVTVIADGTVFNPDLRAVHGAGRTYALGLAHHAGAFHPKLTVLAGAERALIGIGSGNLTIGGWHANDEMLTTIRASRIGGTPVIVRDIVAFLRRLPEVIVISQLAVDGITRTATAWTDSSPPASRWRPGTSSCTA